MTCVGIRVCVPITYISSRYLILLGTHLYNQYKIVEHIEYSQFSCRVIRKSDLIKSVRVSQR